MTETPLTETECNDIGGQAAAAGIYFLSTDGRTPYQLPAAKLAFTNETITIREDKIGPVL